MIAILTRTVREVRSSDQDKIIPDSKVLESLLTVLHTLHENDTQSPNDKPCTGSMYNALGYEIKRLNSTILGAGRGVFVTKGTVPARSLVALYPGTFCNQRSNCYLTHCPESDFSNTSSESSRSSRAYLGPQLLKLTPVSVFLGGMLVHRRLYTPQHFVAGTHLYSWVERGTVRVKSLSKKLNTVTPAMA